MAYGMLQFHAQGQYICYSPLEILILVDLVLLAHLTLILIAVHGVLKIFSVNTNSKNMSYQSSSLSNSEAKGGTLSLKIIKIRVHLEINLTC